MGWILLFLTIGSFFLSPVLGVISLIVYFMWSAIDLSNARARAAYHQAILDINSQDDD